ncbi:MAG TPA: hypothetical protein VEL76_05605 [Gemmataceae bacterium]|nr:hypothetical protein [Gemmataceae bacterium]
MRSILLNALSVAGIAVLVIIMFFALAALLTPEEPEVWDFDTPYDFPRQESRQQDWQFEM